MFLWLERFSDYVFMLQLLAPPNLKHMLKLQKLQSGPCCVRIRILCIDNITPHSLNLGLTEKLFLSDPPLFVF